MNRHAAARTALLEHLAGDNCTLDLDGAPRISNERVDIGACEFQWKPTVFVSQTGSGTTEPADGTTGEKEIWWNVTLPKSGYKGGSYGDYLAGHKWRVESSPFAAGGDIVLGAATVILAMGEGRRAAAGINAYLAK